MFLWPKQNRTQQASKQRSSSRKSLFKKEKKKHAHRLKLPLRPFSTIPISSNAASKQRSSSRESHEVKKKKKKKSMLMPSSQISTPPLSFHVKFPNAKPPRQHPP